MTWNFWGSNARGGMPLFCKEAIVESGSCRDRTPKTGVILDWYRRVFSLLSFASTACVGLPISLR